jgi:CheY-like chemotaxis protein
MRVLVLDDDLIRQQIFARALIGHIVVHTTTVEETIKCLTDQEKFDYIFLDHDLGGKQMVASGPGTGYEVAQWLVAHPEKQSEYIVVHSFNEPGRRNMINLLPNAIDCPGAWLRINV